MVIALKSEGFDVLSAGEEAPPAPGSVDCHVIVSDAGGVQSNGHHRSWRSYLDEDPDLGFADWRDEVLCLASTAG
ncbi:MAG: hypothetical protein ACRD0O_22425 [Acidimicrobiia bacterium]